MGTVVLHIHCIQIRLIAHELCKVKLPNSPSLFFTTHTFSTRHCHYITPPVLYGQGYFVIVVVWVFLVLFVFVVVL